MFAIIFFRLWYLQVLSGDKYLAEANDNRVREIKVQAPRGEIVDRDGACWSTTAPATRSSRAGQAPRGRERARRALRPALARRCAMRRQVVARRVERQLKALPFSSATVKQDVSEPIVA